MLFWRLPGQMIHSHHQLVFHCYFLRSLSAFSLSDAAAVLVCHPWWATLNEKSLKLVGPSVDVILMQHWYRYWYYLIFRRYLRVECIIKFHTYYCYFIIMAIIFSHICCLYTPTFMHCLYICMQYVYGTDIHLQTYLCIFNSGLSIPLFWMNKHSQKASV